MFFATATTAAPKTARPIPTTPSSKVCVPSPATRQHIVAYLGELNHDQERRWQRTVLFHNRQGDQRQLRLFPDVQTVTLPDDPDVVQVPLEFRGLDQSSQLRASGLARPLALEIPSAR